MSLDIQYSHEIGSSWTAWFLYGSMGSGKTRAASTFPDPLFIVPANENSQLTLRQLTLRKIPFIIVGKRPNGTVVPVRAHLSEVLTELEKRQQQSRLAWAAHDKALAEGDAEAAAAHQAAALAHYPWQTIVVESLSHLGDLLVEDVSDYGRKKMDQQGWGVISTFMRTVHSRLRNLDSHIVYTALAKSEESEGGTPTKGGPHLIGQMAEKLPSQCDVVAYLEELPSSGARDKNGNAPPPTYRVYFRKYRWWQARSRFGGFPDFVDNFNYATLEPLVLEGGSSAGAGASAGS